LSSPDALRLRSIVAARTASGTLAAGRVVNGVDLYASAQVFLKGVTPLQPLPSSANDSAVQKVLQDFVDFRQSLFSEPAEDSAWQSAKLAQVPQFEE
jgi:hypothetical protein